MNSKRHYYVYFHKVPDTETVVYIGHGCNERAWTVRPLPEGKTGGGGHRSKEHAQWCQDMMDIGYVPSDWVTIVAKRLRKDQALLVESKLIQRENPKFNKPMGLANFKCHETILNEARKLKGIGYSYLEIGQQLNLSTMTIWRGLNGKTKNTNGTI